MKWFANLLKSQRLVVALGFLFLIALVWLAGSLFEISKTTCLVITLVIFIVWVLWLMFEMARANRGAALLEQSLRAQADEQVMSVSPAKREEIESLQQQLAAAIDSLKRTKLGKGRSGTAALYALPWYMFIGPPASGKTTAIKNSGLEFPFGADHEFQGVGGTRNCDWWFTSDAILLDTAGRYMIEQEDREEWLAFLDILKKHRRRQPINGVLVGISINDLATVKPAEVEAHAKKIRKRIDELIQRLGVRFPVYLVFTKCDLLKGFVEFFEDFSRSQREQIWGCTFTREQQLQTNNPKALFDQEFQILYDTLIGLRLTRLASNMKRENRRQVYVFPLEFYAAKENLGHFIGKLLQPNPYQESPIFRGFYFTSGTQEGLPIDHVIQEVAKAFGLSENLLDEAQQSNVETKSYFIKDLFTDVVIPDERLVGLTSRSARSRRYMRLGVLAGAVVGLIAFILGVSQAYLRNKIIIDNAGDAVAQLKAANTKSPADYLMRLDGVRERLVELEDRADRPLAFSLGLDRSGALLEPVYKIYYKSFNESVVRPNIYSDIHSRVRDIRFSAATYEENYNALKAYLLLGAERGRARLDTANQHFLNNEFNTVLARKMPALMGEPLERQVRFFIKGFANSDDDAPAYKTAPAYENETDLIESARSSLYKQPSIEGVYARLKREANDRLPALTLSSITGGNFRDYFRSDPMIPGAFTKNGWDNYIKEAIDRESANPGRDDWVLGVTSQQLPPNMRDPERMKEVLEQMYFDEYAQNWFTFLRNVDPAPLGGLQSASQRLKLYSDVNASPISALLKKVREETKFESALSQRARSGIGGAIDRASKAVGLSGSEQAQEAKGMLAGHPVDRQFAGLHALVDGGSNGGADLRTLLGHLVLVGDGLEKLKDDPGPNSKDCAAKVLQQQAGDIPQAMSGVRGALNGMDLVTRESVRKIFEQPVRLAWSTVLGETQEQLNKIWRSRVHGTFSTTLGENYPFNAASKLDASPQDVGAFFEPRGVFWSFYEEELQPFIRRDSWQRVTWEDEGIALSGEARNVFEKANAIRQGLLQSGRAELEFEFKPQLPERKPLTGQPPTVDVIYFTVDGKENQYRMGSTYWTPLSWPGREGPPGASLRVPTRDGEFAENGDGTWGFFRLLSKARVTPITRLEYEYRWTFNYQSRYLIIVKYMLRASSSLSNPFAPNFFVFNCPTQLN